MDADKLKSSSNAFHVHCETCIKISRCKVRPKAGESCCIITCALECGARFHECKLSEHKLLCLNEKVPCINSVNGCPVWMLRKHLGVHLETCPASVVHCTMEWNRWPVCSRERQIHIPFRQPNPHVRQGQLDVALALRDQRMLNDWLRAPRRTRRALRNSLTRRFPAVPLQIRASAESDSNETSNQTSRTVTDDEEDTPWEVRKVPPGLKRSVCGELYRASRQATESLSAALNVITNHHSAAFVKWEEKEPTVRDIEAMEEDKENMNAIANDWSAEHHLEQALNQSSAEPMDMEAYVADPPVKSLKNGENMELTIDLDHEIEPLHRYDILFVDDTIVSEISSASMTDHARRQPSPPPPPPPSSPPMFVNLGLDLTLESITRYQTKPKSMYTFLCAQEFRRDEYSWHYKNVHSDIHGGLNGWLEQRCPLAHYGCMFSLRRFFPTCQGASIVHNDILESFGVQPLVPYHSCCKSSTPEKKILTRRSPGRVDKSFQSSGSIDIIPEEGATSRPTLPPEKPSLGQMPFEVLQHVARYLDSFSMCNLAMTSRMMREVCCSLLDERGIVVQQWERHRICHHRLTWRIAYKRWFFSTAFTPVVWWGFEDKENMSNHLQKCAYFQKNLKTEPFYHPMGADPNNSLFEKLRTSAEASVAAAVNVADAQATKL